MHGSKVALGGVSIILVVGVCIGVIASVTNRNSSDQGNSDKDVLSTTSKSVAAICAPTQFKQACVDTLGSVSNNESALPKDFIQAAIHVTLQELQAALNRTGPIFGDSVLNDKTVKMAKDDCDDLLQFAIDELQASFSMVGESELHSMQEREAEIMNWLNAVISYQESCVDQVPHPQLQQQLSNGLLNATQLTSNALAIVSSISQILTDFNLTSSLNLNFGGGNNNRQLITMDDHDKTYPSWVSSADRKLLGSGNNARVTPNAVVAKDGSGQFKTIGDALKAYPKNLQGRYVIYVKAGIYDEFVIVDKNQVNVFMYGDGPRKTMVTGRRCNTDGYTTTDTASFCKKYSTILSFLPPYSLNQFIIKSF